MPQAPHVFAFGDADTLETNLAAFGARLSALDPDLGPMLTGALPSMKTGSDRDAVLDVLFGKLQAQAAASPAAAAPASPAMLSTPLPAAGGQWFLSTLEIEGFRGINNEGAPLKLEFKHDRVNSVSAPNGVGKSSIFEALSFALAGEIPKLTALQAAERPSAYYINLFHPAATGTVKLTFLPAQSGVPVTIAVTAGANGSRSVSGPPGLDADEFLANLNREFVLLDGQTFQTFINSKVLDRGRTFSGLLGLARYSTLRQELQGLCNGRFFNGHFEVPLHDRAKATAAREVAEAKTAITTSYRELVKAELDLALSHETSQAACHASLSQIGVLAPLCAGKTFLEIEIDACVETIKQAEGGTDRQRLGEILQAQDLWAKASHAAPTAADADTLMALADAREIALAGTEGTVLHDLYRLSEQVLTGDDWPAPSLCPTCDRDDGKSVLDVVQSKLGLYATLSAATAAVAAEWGAKGWAELVPLETLVLKAGEAPLIRHTAARIQVASISMTEAAALSAWLAEIRSRATAVVDGLAVERLALEKILPPSLVTVTVAAETARRLQVAWKKLAESEATLKTETARATQVTRIKKFLDEACTTFANAESKIAKERLERIEPVCRALFKDIMFYPVVPALSKRDGSEEISIGLAEFWGKTDVSAQALLSESFRNAFAISVYLAAASLYGGAPRFMVLDDITSSFDAGNQNHLVEVIRTQFARPNNPAGPQVIMLSHDTLLEKLFNKHSGNGDWFHQRLEGTARTAVLPQSGAVNKVRQTTYDLLQAGRVEDASLRLRQYLEFKLLEIIDKCRIPVPVDIAFNDNRKMAGELINAIDTAVKLNGLASKLVLDPTQQSNLNLNVGTITTNFLSHWATGSTQTYNAGALLGILQAIDNYADCFKFAPMAGAPLQYYKSLSQKI